MNSFPSNSKFKLEFKYIVNYLGPIDLSERTVGFIGCGKISSAVCKGLICIDKSFSFIHQTPVMH